MEYTEQQIEEVARKLCAIRGLDPDELVMDNLARKGDGGLATVEVYSRIYQWYAIAQEVNALLERQEREEEIISLLLASAMKAQTMESMGEESL